MSHICPRLAMIALISRYSPEISSSNARFCMTESGLVVFPDGIGPGHLTVSRTSELERSPQATQA